MAEEERRVGVPLIPDRAITRSAPGQWPGLRSDALAHHGVLIGAALSVVSLVVGVVIGHVPVAAAAGVALLVPAAVVDVEQRRLPDVWVVAAFAALVGALALEAAAGRSDMTSSTLAGVAGGALAMALPVLSLHLISPSSMGFGDVKAAVVLGAAAGTIDWRLGIVALCCAALAGAVFGLTTVRRTIAFGPFLVLATIIAVLAHDQIGQALFTGDAA
jgi:leader peptidase (prepilin peptidase)/N-methyltransferase